MTAADELFSAIQAGESLRVASLLDAQPELIRAVDAGGNSPLLTALYYGEPEIAAALVERGSPVNLWEASALGDLPRVQAILASDPAALQTLSHDGWTPLHLAAHFGRAELVRFLLSRGADVHARSKNTFDNHPLHAALAGRHLEVARALLDAGADPNTRQHGGYTPLHEAAGHGDIALLQLLLERGADRSAKEDQGRTPMDLALAEGHPEAVELLRGE
ncbi:MAG TPA: ankyrin repeat domain-containing protein [Anaerolineales bacterium]|nr:ankyrin repeat domain-containing protein [Anaerolineales bacterium]